MRKVIGGSLEIQGKVFGKIPSFGPLRVRISGYAGANADRIYGLK